MKQLRYVLVAIVCICLVVGLYTYLSKRSTDADNVEVSEVQSLILKDLTGNNYPASPREVIRFYNRILTCYYNEELSDEEIKALVEQTRLLMDDELADNKPADTFYLSVKAEIDNYRREKQKMSNSVICSSNDVEYVTIDGADCAYVTCSYYVRYPDKITKTDQKYVLRKDEEDKWKILAFEYLGENIENE